MTKPGRVYNPKLGGKRKGARQVLIQHVPGEPDPQGEPTNYTLWGIVIVLAILVILGLLT